MLMEKRDIKLPNGNILEVQITPAFLKVVREQFKLSENQLVTDSQIRMFIYSCADSAMRKEEESLDSDS